MLQHGARCYNMLQHVTTPTWNNPPVLWHLFEGGSQDALQCFTIATSAHSPKLPGVCSFLVCVQIEMTHCEISGQCWKPSRLYVKPLARPFNVNCVVLFGKDVEKSLHYRSQPQDQHPQKLPVPSAQPLPCASSMFKHVQASDKYLNLDLQTGHGTSWPHQIAWFLDVLGPIMIIMRCGTFPGRIRKDKPWKKARCNGQLSSNHKHQNQEEDEGPKQGLCWSHDSLANLELLEKSWAHSRSFDHILIEAKENES